MYWIYLKPAWAATCFNGSSVFDQQFAGAVQPHPVDLGVHRPPRRRLEFPLDGRSRQGDGLW